MTVQSQRKIQPQYILIGLAFIAAGIGIDISSPHLTIAPIPPFISSNVGSVVGGLGVGLVIGALVGRKPKKGVAG